VIGLDALLDSLPSRVLVCGKGGVGKTTCAGALALRAAMRAGERGDAGFRTLLLSTDPARSLGDAIGAPLGGVPVPMDGVDGLWGMQLDPAAVHSRFLAEWRETLVELFDRGTYLSREESAGIVDAALPGLDESMALLAMLEIEEEGWARVLFDTAPTGHTLRLLELPKSFAALLALLDAMQAKHRFMVYALTRRIREDDIDRFLASIRSRLVRLESALSDPERYATVLVVRAEQLVVDESVRYAARLAELKLAPRAIVVNALPSRVDADGAAAIAMLARTLPDVQYFDVELLEDVPADRAGLLRWGGAVRARSASAPVAGATNVMGAAAAAAEPRSRPRARFDAREAILARVAPLTIVAGKGGVGKTTAACALALALADRGVRTLLVSTDPAPSIADALAQSIGDEAVEVEGTSGLVARQLDASSAFSGFRERYQEKVDRLFDSLMRGALDAAHDRVVVRDLLALAPPGIDEVYALSVLGEELANGGFDRIVVDPAPTGHLLRLLELPAQAVAWTHRLLRLMLDYREVVPLGEASMELTAFARRTRALQAMLRDGSRASVIAVALDEPLVRDESARLLARLEELGIPAAALLWNRAESAAASPLPLARPLPQFEAPITRPAPRGVEALRAWSESWRSVPSDAH